MTTELLGFHRNGGIGTCYTHLAEALAQDGHKVHVLLVELNPPPEAEERQAAIEEYLAKGIHVHVIECPYQVVSHHSFAHRRTQAAYDLRKRLEALDAETPFDLVHVSDGYGLALDCLRLKRQGLAFRNTLFLVGLHSPTLWIEEANGSMHLNAQTLSRDVAERTSVELADILWSPSHYLLDWIRQEGWVLPEHTFVLPYLGMESKPDHAQGIATSDRHPPAISTLVFFGRLEPRKGMYVFLDALGRLAGRRANSKLPHIVFLGKSVYLASGAGCGKNSDEYISGLMETLPFTYEIAGGMDHAAALELLQQPGTLAVIPSLVDNSPNTVYECLLLGIPFLASRTGGIPELIHPDDVADATFPHIDPERPSLPTAELLASKLEEQMFWRDPLRPIRPAYDAAEIRRQWLEWHRRLPLASQRQEAIESVAELADPTRLAVCMATEGRRTQLLAQAVDSLREQTCQGFRVVIVNDGGSDPDFLAYCDAQKTDFEMRGWKLIHQDNQYVGKARNRAEREAAADFALFMDDDNRAQPLEVETLLRALAVTGSAIFTCGLRYVDEKGDPILVGSGSEAVYIPVGPCPVLALLDNCLGDLNFLVSTATFRELGGFPEERGLPFTDWIFLARACLRGVTIEVVPEILLDYTVTQSSLSRTNGGSNLSRMALCKEYAALLPPALRRLPAVMHFSMREMGGGLIPPAQDLYQQLKITQKWAEKTIAYYTSRSEYYETRSNWYEGHAGWQESEIAALQAQLEELKTKMANPSECTTEEKCPGTQSSPRDGG